MRLLALLALGACGPATVKLGDTAGGEDVDDTDDPTFTDACPNIGASESELIWSTIPVGAESSRTVTVTNACSGETSLAISVRIDGDAVFGVTTTVSALAPGESGEVTVTYTPVDEVDSAGVLVIASNDPDTPELTVGLAGTTGTDADGDGYSSEAAGGEDCDDGNPAIHPGANEVWYDGIDQDCDDLSDYDQDGDGDDADGYGGADCDDLDADIGPSAPETLDLEDDDCDTWVDEDFVVAGSVVVSEIMHHPLAVADTAGEWFEIANTGAFDIDLVGFVVGGDDGDSVTIEDTTVVAAGGVVVLAVNGSTASNGGAMVDYVYDRTDLSLSSDDNLILTQAGEVIFDVEWTSAWYDADGASLSLDPDHFAWSDARTSAYWCPARTAMSGGDHGTPAAANDHCTSIDEDGDGYSPDAGDCDDTDANVSPGRDEVWDGVDNDCDGSVDVGEVAELSAGYVDGTAGTYLTFSSGLAIADLTGDATPDLAVGGTMLAGRKGAVYVIDGDDHAGLAGEADDYDAADVTGASNNYFGVTPAVAGDHTGDGQPDLVVAGSDYYTSWYGGTGVGIYEGGSLSGSLDSGDADTTIDGSGSYSTVVSVAGDLDVDGDGVDEVVLAHPMYYQYTSTNSVYAGRVWIVDVSGGGDLDVDDASATIDGEENYDYLGAGVGGADVNGDGYDDLFLGAPGEDGGADGGGAWFVLHGGASGDGDADVGDVADRTIWGADGDGQVGVGTAAVGDFDDDGKADFATGGLDTDHVWVFYDLAAAPSELDTDDADADIDGDGDSSLGFSLAVGDFDGDGVVDLAAGAPAISATSTYWYMYYSMRGADVGGVYFFAGGTFDAGSYDTGDAGFAVTGETSGDLFGAVLSGPGDLDGDASDDLLVGAPRAGSSAAGRAYVVLGG
ncbi:MAG: MopE-related protein [Myxococcota bacterium]